MAFDSKRTTLNSKERAFLSLQDKHGVFDRNGINEEKTYQGN